MRFGEELVAERIPGETSCPPCSGVPADTLFTEWADKYLDYKTGKKLIKSVADAIARAEQGGVHIEPQPLERASNVERSGQPRLDTIESAPESPSSDRPLRSPRSLEAAEGVDPIAASPPLPPSRDGHMPHGDHVRFERSVSPPSRAGSGSGLKLDVAGLGVNRYAEAPRQHDPDLHRQATTAGMDRSGTVMGRSATQRRRHGRAMNAILSSYPFSAVRTRFFEGDAMMEEPLNPTDPVEQEKNEFFKFMLTELQKIETFYASKEKDAEKRLGLLREQLYEMRSRRGEDEFRSDMAKKKKGSSSEKDSQGLLGRVKGSVFELKSLAPGKSSHKGTSPAVVLATPILTALPATESQKRRDFVPKLVVDDEDVSYPEAKRKLKIALHEFYRTLNMVNSYAALNRTAFQKLNKKYDKNARSSEKLEFVRHYVDKSAFVNSTTIEDHMRTVEDLFARYFEHGDNKTAMTKLRSRSVRDEFTGTFFSGLLVGFGFVFSVQGLISALRMRFDPNLDLSKHEVVGSHMQIYAGYFMILCMLWMFCLICKIWTQAKVNYQFIFEFDTRHSLDWRKLCHFPAVFTLLFGVIFWLNFSAQFGGDTIFLYYPVILIGVTLLIIFLPLPIFHHKSRLWFAYSNYRLLMAPFYEVEFRDVFLGDIYTSLRYAFAVSFFFSRVMTSQMLTSHRTRSSSFASTSTAGTIRRCAVRVGLDSWLS